MLMFKRSLNFRVPTRTTTYCVYDVILTRRTYMTTVQVH